MMQLVEFGVKPEHVAMIVAEIKKSWNDSRNFIE